MSIQIKPDKEQMIYNYIIIDYPNHGPSRISNEIATQGINIKASGIYNVLRRKDLNHPLYILFYAQNKSDIFFIIERHSGK